MNMKMKYEMKDNKMNKWKWNNNIINNNEIIYEILMKVMK